MFNLIDAIRRFFWEPELVHGIKRATRELRKHPEKYIRRFNDNDTSPITDGELLENYRRYVIRTKRKAHNKAVLSTRDIIMPYEEYVAEVQSEQTVTGGRKYMSALHADAFVGNPLDGTMVTVHFTDEFDDPLFA